MNDSRACMSFDVLRRYLVDGKSVGEIAEALDIPLANVRHLLLKPHKIRVRGDGYEKIMQQIRSLGYNSASEYLTENWQKPVTVLARELGTNSEKVSHLYTLLAQLEKEAT